MCLETRQIKPRVAEQDIIAYKSLTTKQTGKFIPAVVDFKTVMIPQVTVKSSRTGFRYTFGKLYKAKLGHFRNTQGIGNNTVESGFHFFKNRAKAGTYGAVECIIPKGSLYYEGTNNGDSEGYTANQIIITKFI